MKRFRRITLLLICAAFLLQQSISVFAESKKAKKTDEPTTEKIHLIEMPKYESEAKKWSSEKLKEFKIDHKNKIKYDNVKKDSVIIRFLDDTKKDSVITEIKSDLKITQLEQIESLELIDAFVYRYNDSEVNIKKLVEEILNNAEVEFAEPVQIGSLSSTSQSYSLNSPHNYSNNYNTVWNVYKPGASRIRVHFSTISTETNYDYVYTSAGDSWTGSYSDTWSSWQTGSSIRVRLTADSSITGWGFAIDNIEYDLGGSSNPNDTYFSNQWGIPNVNTSTAWNNMSDGNGVTVGVIDTGIDYSHSDLTENIAYNFNEIPNNGVDDDSNGKVDDYYGWNFYNNNSTVFNSSNNADNNGHGTINAGIIAASGNNSTGVIGVAHNAKILPLRCCGDLMLGFYIDGVISSIQYGITRNVKVFNMSFSCDYSLALQNAISAASSALFVCSANNNGIDLNTYNSYPASFNLSNMIIAANLQSDGSLYSSSNYGTSIDIIGAPGTNIYSTMPNNSYGYMTGTSQAAPFISGLAALIYGRHPSYTPQQVKQAIFNNYTSVPTLSGKLKYPGKINIGAAASN